jgi:hypothetical protein
MTETAMPDDPAATAEPEVLVQLTMNSPNSTVAVSGGDVETDDIRSARQKIVDAFEDNEGDLIVSQIMQDTALPRSDLDRQPFAGLIERFGSVRTPASDGDDAIDGEVVE